MIIVETVSIELTDDERARAHEKIAKTVSELQEAGLEPCVSIETTSGGDVFLIEADWDLGDS